MTRCLALLLMAVSFAVTEAGARGGCEPQLLARLEGRTNVHGILFLPATFGARTTELVFGTGGWSELSEEIVSELRLRPMRVLDFKRGRSVAGDMSSLSVRVPAFNLGGHTLNNAPFFVMDKREIDKGGGVLGSDNLSKFDVELDGNTVTLYKSSFSCSAKPAGWNETWHEIPMVLVDGIPDLKVKVNGHDIDMTLQSGATRTLMNLTTARKVFGITPDTPGVDKLGEQSVSGGNKLPIYAYTIPTLEMSGLRFQSVRVAIADFFDTTISLGLPEMRQLRWYIAYQRKTVYATRRESAR